MQFQLDVEQETDGPWLAEVSGLPGVLAYGDSRDAAVARAEVLALRVLAKQLEAGESRPIAIDIALASTAA